MLEFWEEFDHAGYRMQISGCRSVRKGGGLVDAPGRGPVGVEGNSPF
jgi:hypothetical protein